MSTFREMFTSLAPFFTAAVVIVLSPFVKEHIPSAVSNYLVSMYQKWLSRFSKPQVTVVIEDRGNLKISNQIYEAARAYLRTLISNSTKPTRFKVNKERQNESTIDIIDNEDVIDIFIGIRLKWKLHAAKDVHRNIERYLELSFDKGFENEVLESYLPDIVKRYERIQNDDNVVKLYTRNNGLRSVGRDLDGKWIYVLLKHPITFEKLAMDPKQKEMLIDDLDRFLGRKDLYEDVGKTWKRGYLLYGPPGTGKSSLIAAMANYLKFDIYDLNLSDCGAELDHHRRQYDSFTLSGLLNIIDGLWSSCGEERIIVFTTNDKDKLDPALLRPGRMDVHVHMSYCTIDGFKLLATDYLKIEGDHQLYRQIEGLLKNVEVTPAEIAEELLKSDGTDVVLRGVVKFLAQKEREKAKAAELNERLKERLKSADIDVDAKGLVKYLKQKKVENAKAKEAEQLLNSGDTDADVEGLVKFFKQKKIEEAKAAEAKRKNPKES
nr:aaa-atpase [Quercus suber]